MKIFVPKTSITVFVLCYSTFVCFPNVLTFPLLLVSLVSLCSGGYYTEALIAFAGAKGFHQPYLGSAFRWLDLLKLPLVIAFLSTLTFFSGWHKRISPSQRNIALFTFFGLFTISIFSEDPGVSLSKIVSVYLAYQMILAIGVHQKRIYPEFLLILVVLQAIINLIHRFNLYMPDEFTASGYSNLYSGGWSHSQSAGIIYAFLALILILSQEIKFFIKIPLLGFLSILLYLTQCRTAMLGVIIVLVFFSKSFRMKLMVVLLGACFVLLSPKLISNFLNKRESISLGAEKNFLSNLYSSRMGLIQERLDQLSVKRIFVGRGLGVGSYLNESVDVLKGAYYESMEETRLEQRNKSAIKIFGLNIKISQPVEYGNIITGSFEAVGLIGIFFCFLYFHGIYKILTPRSKILFWFVIITNLGEAILYSPSGNPVMLFMMATIVLIKRSDEIKAFQMHVKTRPAV